MSGATCGIGGFVSWHAGVVATPAVLAAEMLIHHNVAISQRLRERSGGMREPWQHGGGRRAAGGQRSGAKEEELSSYCDEGTKIRSAMSLIFTFSTSGDN